MILKVGQFKSWSKHVYSQELVRNLHENIKEAYFKMIYDREKLFLNDSSSETNKLTTQRSESANTAPDSSFHSEFSLSQENSGNHSERTDDLLSRQKVDKELEAEISLFLTIFQSNEFRNKDLVPVSTRLFLLANIKNFKLLIKLSLILLNIPASSSFIERFLSITGIICKKNSLNISDDLLICTSLLKVNLNFFENMIFEEEQK